MDMINSSITALNALAGKISPTAVTKAAAVINGNADNSHLVNELKQQTSLNETHTQR